MKTPKHPSSLRMKSATGRAFGHQDSEIVRGSMIGDRLKTRVVFAGYYISPGSGNRAWRIVWLPMAVRPPLPRLSQAIKKLLIDVLVSQRYITLDTRPSDLVINDSGGATRG